MSKRMQRKQKRCKVMYSSDLLHKSLYLAKFLSSHQAARSNLKDYFDEILAIGLCCDYFFKQTST